MMRVKREGRSIDLLDSRHVMSVILFLFENGPSKRVEIYDAVSRNTNMREKLIALMDNGIIQESPTFNGPVLDLTDLGRQVADMLKSMEKLLDTGSQTEQCVC